MQQHPAALLSSSRQTAAANGRRHAARLSASLLVALLVLVGCSQAPQPGPRPPGKASQPALGKLTPDEQKAVELAQAFLAKNQTDWGSPSKIERTEVEFLPGLKGDSVYQVTYPTPADELPLLGDRSVVVDVKTECTAYVPRE